MSFPVLIVDDDEPTRLLLEALLAHDGIPCDQAEDGSVALRKIGQTDYGAILLDLLLPVVNGFEVLRSLNATRPDVLPQIVVITAAADSTWRGCGELRFVRCVLRKPLDIHELIGHVHGCMARIPVATRAGQA